MHHMLHIHVGSAIRYSRWPYRRDLATGHWHLPRRDSRWLVNRSHVGWCSESHMSSQFGCRHIPSRGTRSRRELWPSAHCSSWDWRCTISWRFKCIRLLNNSTCQAIASRKLFARGGRLPATFTANNRCQIRREGESRTASEEARQGKDLSCRFCVNRQVWCRRLWHRHNRSRTLSAKRALLILVFWPAFLGLLWNLKRWAYMIWCFTILKLTIATEDRIPSRKRVAALCLPSLLERCRRTLVGYVADEALRGNLPFPRFASISITWFSVLTLSSEHVKKSFCMFFESYWRLNYGLVPFGLLCQIRRQDTALINQVCN